MTKEAEDHGIEFALHETQVETNGSKTPKTFMEEFQDDENANELMIKVDKVLGSMKDNFLVVNLSCM